MRLPAITENRNRVTAILIAVVAVTLVALPAVAIGSRIGHGAAALPAVINVKVAGEGNDGYYVKSAVTLKLAKQGIKWVWASQTSEHDVRFDRASSSAAVRTQSFTSSDSVATYPGASYSWPTRGSWKPTKPGKYVFYCSKHSLTMRMTVTVVK